MQTGRHQIDDRGGGGRETTSEVGAPEPSGGEPVETMWACCS